MTGPRFQMPDRRKAPWVLRLPSVFQINSSLIFIAFMVSIVGLAALFGFSDPQSITSQMAYPFYKAWGFGLTATGIMLAVGIFRRDELIEKFAARILSMMLFTFAAWAIAAVGMQKSIVTTALTIVVVFLLEQRISLINVLLYAQMIQRRADKNKSTEINPGGKINE